MLVALTAFRAGAQRVPLGAGALSAGAVAESLTVLKTLDDVVRANRNDAAAWYRQGMIAWALAIRAQEKPAISGLNQIRYNRMADTSLRIAAQIEPKNVRYLMGIGLFLRYSPDVVSRTISLRFLSAATEAARDIKDPAARAEIALEMGRVHWLRYNDEANRRQLLQFPKNGAARLAMADVEQPDLQCPNSLPTSLDDMIGVADPAPDRGTPQPKGADAKGASTVLHNLLIECTEGVPGAGEADYIEAENGLREAFESAPGDPRAFRHLAMLLAEKNRWPELALSARVHARSAPTDAVSWLALGLALHRSLQSDRAAAAFDTALARLSAAERGRLFAFTRLLGRKDSATYAKATADARARTEQTFWAMSDPLWSREGDEPQTEFLARVTFAELRWTVDELGVRGADSDRGEIYIRYGPPNGIGVLRGGDYVAPKLMEQTGSAFNRRGPGPTSPAKPPQSAVITFWEYSNLLAVIFWGAPTYGTARFPIGDVAHIADRIESTPASFDNMVRDRIDDIAFRSVRFRAPGDSVELLFLTRAPMDSIHRGSSANSPVREHAWLVARDSVSGHLDSLVLDATGIKAWSYRVPPSVYLFRVEATAEGGSAAGRAMTQVTAGPDAATGFTMRGFGISDVLVATRIVPIGNPARWRDFNVAPLLGPLEQQSSLELLWENYDFGQRNGQAQYQITVTIQKKRSGSGRIAAQIVGAMAGAVGVNRRDDRVALQFERAAAYAPAFVDRVTIALADTPAGTYGVLLEITDRVTDRKTNRATEITIR